jgi:hypothetical protein
MQSSCTDLNYVTTTHKINTEFTDLTKCRTGHIVHLLCHNIQGVDFIIIIIIIISGLIVVQWPILSFSSNCDLLSRRLKRYNSLNVPP